MGALFSCCSGGEAPACREWPRDFCRGPLLMRSLVLESFRACGRFGGSLRAHAVANASSTMRRKVRPTKQVPPTEDVSYSPFYPRKRNPSLMEVRKFRTRLSGIVVPHACGRNAQHRCRAESPPSVLANKESGAYPRYSRQGHFRRRRCVMFNTASHPKGRLTTLHYSFRHRRRRHEGPCELVEQ